MKRISIFIFCVLLINLAGTAQERLLQGRVTTFDSIPLMKATIEVASSEKQAVSDTLGYFQLFCQPEDKIVISARGFGKQKVQIEAANTFILVNLKLKKGDYNKELAVGQGHVKANEKLFAMSTLDNEEVDYSTYPTLERAIVGRFAGVTVRNGEVIVRGNETFGAGNGALVVIDGVARGYSIAGIPPYTVKSITILKDASAAAYGSQGANGVVLIETKRGGDK